MALFTKEEARAAVFSLHPDKAHGPNGFPAMFSQTCWDFLKANIWKLVEDVRCKGKFVREINNTVLVIITKKANAKSLDEFRPIALCNTVYKIITKAFTNKLRKVLSKLISEEKNGFTPGREIADSIILTAKSIHSITTTRKKSMLIKLDISKAYDKVRWDFLVEVLERFGFDNNWIQVFPCGGEWFSIWIL